MTASVVGATGYGGGELLRLLDAHPDLEVGAVAAGGNAGRLLGELHPRLVTLADRRLVAAEDPTVADADVVFLALPHGESARVAGTLPADARIVDLGADFRLHGAADWERFYGGQHAGTWAYGLPELPGSRETIRTASRVANPGCYATAITLALAPLLAAGLVDASDIVVVAASGTTGAGRVAKPNLLGSEVMSDLSPYKVGGVHQHLPEVAQALRTLAGRDIGMTMTPILAPLPRGILATVTARQSGVGDGDSLRAALQTAYADEPFVTVLPSDQWPHTAATIGSNSCQLQVTADSSTGRAVVVSAIDNLGKGAAGQALQNANLMLGLPETAGLAINGVAP